MDALRAAHITMRTMAEMAEGAVDDDDGKDAREETALTPIMNTTCHEMTEFKHGGSIREYLPIGGLHLGYHSTLHFRE